MKKYLVWLWRNTTGIRMNMLVRIVAGFGRVSFGLLMVWLCKQFIDTTIRKGSEHDVMLMIACIVAVVFAGILCRQVYYYCGLKAEVYQSTSIRLRIFSHLFYRRMYHQKEMHSGDISSRLEKDISTVSDATTSMIPDLCVTGIQLVGAFLLMQSMDARLAWLLLFFTPFFILIGKLVAYKIRKMTMGIRQQESLIQMLVQESMEHNAVLRSLESGSWIRERLAGQQYDLRKKVYYRAQFNVLFRLLIAISFNLGYIVAFIWGGLQLRAGVITFGVMTSFLQLVGQIQQPILQMVNLLPKMFETTASIERLLEIEEMEAETCEGKEVMEGRLGLRLQDVSFSYTSDDNMLLSHFSHDFTPGSKTSIVGCTGAGKTTLFRLMLALLKPKEGSQTIYGNGQSLPISENTRSNFVFVPQGNTLMSGTIRFNLLLAKPDATDDELHQVLHTAMADFVYELPEGIDTICGERGSGLSEGQAQRIAIARGLLRPGSIMLLDEISSSLDEQTEGELYRRLFAKYPQKTMIFITHRPTVCALCDEVVRL